MESAVLVAQIDRGDSTPKTVDRRAHQPGCARAALADSARDCFGVYDGDMCDHSSTTGMRLGGAFKACSW